MSQENVELVRRLFQAYADEGRESEKADDYFDPGIVWNPADEAAQHGLDAVRAYMERWESEWENLSTIPEDFLDAGDRVIVTVHFSGRGRTSGIDVDALLYEVYEVRAGKVVRMDEFVERGEALAAAGVAE
jgi:ketosteroid isomerase-like protein